MEMQFKTMVRPVEVKQEGEKDTLHIKAYALAFDNVDSWGDIIAPTACDRFLAGENAARMKLCYQHEMNEVIGVITDKGVDAIGMWIEADILPTATGRDVQTLMKAGAIDEFSIGYYADEYHYERKEGYANEIRVLDAITIIEVSPVTRAANAKAVLVDMKNDNPEQENKPLTPDTHMEEMKKQLETIKQEAAEAKAAAEKALAEKSAELEKANACIDNLDASVKAQETAIADLRKMIAEQPKTWKKAMRDALDGVKGSIEGFIKSTGRYTVEFKVASPAGAAYGSVLDPNVHAVPVLGNAFLLAFRNVTVNGNKLAWIEASTTKNVGYVAELAASTASNVAFVEKTRAMAKIATYMEISSETEGWYEMLYDFCVAEGQRLIMKYADTMVWAGAGDDTSKPKEVYGIKTNSTAFAKVGTYANANVGDVILDAIMQVQKAGFNADIALVSYGTLAELRGVKDTAGNYLYNQLTGMFGQVKVYPSDQLTKEIVVADSFCAEIAFAPLYELEFSRQASTDSWRVDFRRHVQVKTPTAKKAGIIYVADKAAAITAITQA